MAIIQEKEKLSLIRKDAEFNIGFSALKGSLEELESLINILHHHEINKFESFQFDKRKLSYLLGKLSAKQAIQSIENKQSLNSIEITEGIFQFPVIKNLIGGNKQLSISHCENIGLSLVYPEEHPMGIDIERANEKSADALLSQVSESEIKLMKALNVLSEVECLTALWTIKEALSKIFRTGMMLDFKVLEVSSVSIENGIITSHYQNCGQYKAITFFNKPYLTSITIPAKSEMNVSLIAKKLQSVIEY